MAPSDRQRRANEKRRLQRQAQRRHERALRRRRVQIIASVVGVAVVVAVVALVVVMGGNDSDTAAGRTPTPTPTGSVPVSPSASPTTASPSATVAAYPCTWTKSGTAARSVHVPSTTKPSRSGTVAMQVQTTRGAMTFTLDRAKAPCAAESFVSLAAQKYFDNTPCHRLTSGSLSVLQCGDPTGTGTGGPGYSFGDELTGKETYTRGVLAMANSGANTNGSQFFIVYKNSQLPAKYTVFGTVSRGLGVVDKVAAAGSSPAGDGKPKLSISLSTVRRQG